MTPDALDMRNPFGKTVLGLTMLSVIVYAPQLYEYNE